MDERRTDTREAIRSVALELFAEQGYAKTSLREISERLGVTKAAVYYHFKTKEEILVSLIEDFLAQVDDVVDWAQSQPADVATRHEVLRRYSELLGGRTTQLARFMQEGQAAIRDLAAGTEMRKRFDRLVGILATPGQPLPTQLRARVALMALHVGAFAGRDIEATDEQRRDAALQLALEIVGPAS
ncbi:MAG: TetR/AcrR family transcriptional regulator [Actinomycetota bacterium]|nr:TetR/AcrR family transcriptional regulator [Actinomycetota bacterium]